VDDFYEFRAGDFEGTCGIGKDYLQLLPDGKMQYTSRGDYGETTGILDRIIPVIYDDDGSPDGTTALMYLLSDARISVKAVNISYGEANPEVYIQYIGGLLDTFGFADIPLGAGQPPSLPGNHVFPDWIRDAADNFWGMPKPDTGKTYPVQDAAQLIVDTVNNAKEPITIFISGPCTNLAAALRLDPGIRDNIKAVYIMGGAVHVLGNLSDLVTDPENGWAEWNIYADAQAASEVFASGLEIYLVPLDATNEVTISNQDIAEWSKGAPQAVFAANFYQSIMGSDPAKEIYIWDIMTAEIMTQPYLCRFKDMEIQIVTKEGNNYGQTNQVVRGNPNAYVCVEPIIGEVRGQLDNIFRISH
jgi:inosine-uridine nucleoside N-ribohydrolase